MPVGEKESEFEERCYLLRVPFHTFWHAPEDQGLAILLHTVASNAANS
jgi:hypothetical protein